MLSTLCPSDKVLSLYIYNMGLSDITVLGNIIINVYPEPTCNWPITLLWGHSFAMCSIDVLPGTSQLLLLKDHNFKLGKRTSGARAERVKYRTDLTHLRPGYVSWLEHIAHIFSSLIFSPHHEMFQVYVESRSLCHKIYPYTTLTMCNKGQLLPCVYFSSPFFSKLQSYDITWTWLVG